MTRSLTTALEEMTINNEQLRRENDVIKSDNTQLRTSVDAMKNEITQQKIEITLQKNEITQLQTQMAVDNENKMQQIYSQSSEIVQLRAENQQQKVSQWSGITSYSYTIPNIHTLRT